MQQADFLIQRITAGAPAESAKARSKAFLYWMLSLLAIMVISLLLHFSPLKHPVLLFLGLSAPFLMLGSLIHRIIRDSFDRSGERGG